ncbi:MAG: hypothetical protein ACRDHY_16040 [Anaerolineales bacterium]
MSWWEYHVLALFGVSTIAYGLVIDYRRGPGIEKALAALLARGSVRTLEESYTEVLTGLTAAIEARDPYTKGHSEKSLGWPPPSESAWGWLPRWCAASTRPG